MAEPACAATGRASIGWRVAAGAAAIVTAAAAASSLGDAPVVAVLAGLGAIALGAGAVTGRCRAIDPLGACSDPRRDPPTPATRATMDSAPHPRKAAHHDHV